MNASYKKQIDKFSEGIIGREIVGVTIEDETLVFVLDDDSTIILQDDDGDLLARHGRYCDD